MSGQILRSGTHIARTEAVKMPDGTYEARVFVRLEREPDIAETYIPSGLYQTQQEALDAAQTRAARALREHEF